MPAGRPDGRLQRHANPAWCRVLRFRPDAGPSSRLLQRCVLTALRRTGNVIVSHRSKAPMNPLRWSYRFSFAVGFLVCAALMGFALYAEYAWEMTPCPLCIFQRVGFIVMGMFFLLGALHAPRGGLRWIYAAGVWIGAVFGIVVAARHLWIQSLPADQIPSCGPPLDYMFSAFPFAKVLRMVFTGSGECAAVEPILGLPMPAWTLLWFVLLAVLTVVAVRRRTSHA
jgi:disulfide bond formation protein DsbB